MTKVCAVVGKTPKEIYRPGANPEEFGYVNQYGLSRKVGYYRLISYISDSLLNPNWTAYL